LAKHFLFCQSFGKTLNMFCAKTLLCYFHLLDLFIRIREKLFQGYSIRKSFLVIGDYIKLHGIAQNHFFCAPSVLPPFPPLSPPIQCLPGQKRCDLGRRRPGPGLHVDDDSQHEKNIYYSEYYKVHIICFSLWGSVLIFL